MFETLPIKCVAIYEDRIVVLLARGPAPESISAAAAGLLEAYAWARERLDAEVLDTRGKLL